MRVDGSGWESIYYPLLLSQCCDELGISMSFDDRPDMEWSWRVAEPVYKDSWDNNEFYVTPTAAREAGIEFVLGGTNAKTTE
jgi:hypothetical protein